MSKFSTSACGIKAIQMSGGQLTAEDVDNYVSKLGFKDKLSFKKQLQSGGLDPIAKKINSDIAKKRFETKIKKREEFFHVLNSQKFKDSVMDWESKGFKNGRDGFINHLVGTQDKVDGARDSLVGKIEAMKLDATGDIVTILDKHGILDGLKMAKPNEERSFAIAIERAEFEAAGKLNEWQSKRGYANEKIAPEYINAAKEYVAMQHKQIDYINAQGGSIQKLPGRIAGMNYDMMKLNAASDPGSIGLMAKITGTVEDRVVKSREKFVNDMLGLWDEAESRKRIDFGEFDSFNSKEFMESVFNSRSTGKELDQSPEVSSYGMSSGVVGSSKTRMIIPKDADAFLAMNRMYGKGSLLNAIIGDVQSLAKDSIIITEVGPKPQKVFDEIKSELYKQKSGPNQLEGRQRFASFDRFDFKSYEDLVLGKTTYNDITYASLGRMIRGWETAVKLPFAGLTSTFFDTANATYLQRVFKVDGAINPIFESFGTFFGRSGSNVRDKEFANALGLGLEGFLGRVHAESYGVGKEGNMAKFVNWSMTVNRLQPVTDATKTMVGINLTTTLGRASDKGFDELEKPMARLLMDYGINKPEWELLRKYVQEVKGNKIIYQDVAELITDAEINAYTKSLGGKYEVSPDAARMQLKAKMANLVRGFSNTLISTPDDRLRALMQGGEQGGLWSELGKSMILFKGFTAGLAYNMMGVGRRYGFENVLALAGINSVVGLAYYYTKEFLRGRKPPELSPKTVLNGVLMGGGLSYIGDLVLSPALQGMGGGTLTSFIGGPVVGDIEKILDKAISKPLKAMIDPEKELGLNEYATDLSTLLKKNTPVAGLPGIVALTDYLHYNLVIRGLLNNPDYVDRLNQNAKKDGKSGYFIQP